MNCLYLFSVFILLINYVWAKKNVIQGKEDYYLVYVSNPNEEFKIYSDAKDNNKSQEFIKSLVDKINSLILDNMNTYEKPKVLKDFKESNSNYVYPISSIKENVVLYTYLSGTLVNEVKSLDHIIDCIPSLKNAFTVDSYYNEKDILNETQWSSLEVQNGADLHLSLISQGIFDKHIVNEYDRNYYYPSSAGKDVNVVILDSSFDFDYSEFANKEDRITKCAANVEKGIASTDRIEEYCGNDDIENNHGKKVSDVVGGLVHGVAKRANIYGVSIPVKNKNEVEDVDILGGLQYIYENLIISGKTVINLSLSAKYNINDKYYSYIKTVIDSITEKGGIVVASSGNREEKLAKGDDQRIPCEFDNVICVSGLDTNSVTSNTFKDVFISYFKKYSYGTSVDVYAPGLVRTRTNEFDAYGEKFEHNSTAGGSSFSASIVSGIIATYMSENLKNKNETSFEIIKNYLIDNGSKEQFRFFVNTFIEEHGKLANNGKHIVYSSDNVYKNNGCGVSAGNIPCKNKTTPVITKTVTKTRTTTTTTSRITSSSSSVPTIDSDAKPQWIYNPYINKCLYAQPRLDREPLVKDCLDNPRFKWYPASSSNGYIFSYANNNRCLKVSDSTEGLLKVGICEENENDKFKINKSTKSISLSEDKDKCLSTNDEGDSGCLRECERHEDKQKWTFWMVNPVEVINAETETVWIYNRKLNKCLYYSGIPNSRPIISDCDDSENSKWQISDLEYGFIRSAYDQDYCLDVTNIKTNTVAVRPCGNNSVFTGIYDKNIKSILSDEKCLGLLDSNKSNLGLGVCDGSRYDQYWDISETLPN